MASNGAGPIASAHVFTFRSPRDAVRSLVRDREQLARVPGLRFARLVFAGARRWEAMAVGWIDPRRQLAMCVWEEEAALDRFRERSPIGRAWRGQTDQYCEVRMAPFRTHGTYRGLEPLAGLRAQAAPAGPVAMLTFANIPARGLVYFYRGLHRSTGPLLASDGLIAAVGGTGAAGPRRHDIHHLGLTARRARILLPPRPAPGDRAERARARAADRLDVHPGAPLRDRGRLVPVESLCRAVRGPCALYAECASSRPARGHSARPSLPLPDSVT